jgi:23S rRNA (pseudouridine1915-N3)-methyltransferase
MSWTLLTFDHKPASWLEDRLAVYLKRLNHWIDVEHKIITPSGLSQLQQAKQLDWEKFQHHKILSKKTLVVFDENGSLMTSDKLSKLVAQWELQRDVCFVVGPSYGLSPLWRDHATSCLSLSNLTLTHEFAQLLVTEQLFRAFTILKGLPYHIA